MVEDFKIFKLEIAMIHPLSDEFFTQFSKFAKIMAPPKPVMISFHLGKISWLKTTSASAYPEKKQKCV